MLRAIASSLFRTEGRNSPRCFLILASRCLPSPNAKRNVMSGRNARTITTELEYGLQYFLFAVTWDAHLPPSGRNPPDTDRQLCRSSSFLRMRLHACPSPPSWECRPWPGRVLAPGIPPDLPNDDRIPTPSRCRSRNRGSNRAQIPPAAHCMPSPPAPPGRTIRLSPKVRDSRKGSQPGTPLPERRDRTAGRRYPPELPPELPASPACRPRRRRLPPASMDPQCADASRGVDPRLSHRHSPGREHPSPDAGARHKEGGAGRRRERFRRET